MKKAKSENVVVTALPLNTTVLSSDKISTSIDNYAQRDVEKSANELLELKLSIMENGIKEPLHVDIFGELISGYTRFSIVKEIEGETGKKIDIPVIVEDINVCTLPPHEIKIMQATFNKRVNVPSLKNVLLVRECSDAGMDNNEIARKLGITLKTVLENLGIHAENEHVKEMFKRGVSKTNIIEYCKSFKSDGDLERNADFVQLFFNKTGTELKKAVSLFKNQKRLKEMKATMQETFTLTPTINSRFLTDNQRVNLTLSESILNNVAICKEIPEELKSGIMTICNNMLSAYSMDSVSIEESRLSFLERNKSIMTEREKLATKVINLETSLVKKEAQEAAKNASEKVLKKLSGNVVM